MLINDRVDVGDYITDTYGIYKVTEIKAQENDKGVTSSILYYKSVLKTDKNCLTHIPVKNLSKAGLRKVISKQMAKEILSKKVPLTRIGHYDITLAKDEAYQNDPEKTIALLYYIWTNQATMSKVETELMWKIVDTVAQEISFVTDENVVKVRNKLVAKLPALGPGLE